MFIYISCTALRCLAVIIKICPPVKPQLGYFSHCLAAVNLRVRMGIRQMGKGDFPRTCNSLWKTGACRRFFALMQTYFIIHKIWMRVGRYQSCVNCLHVEISVLMQGGGDCEDSLQLAFFFFERRQRNQSVNSFTALLSPNRLHTALAPTSITCANQSSLMLCVLSVRSRDNLVGGTEWPFETHAKKKKKWNEIYFHFPEICMQVKIWQPGRT